MIKVSLKDGLVKEFEAGVSAAEVAKSLGGTIKIVDFVRFQLGEEE